MNGFLNIFSILNVCFPLIIAIQDTNEMPINKMIRYSRDAIEAYDDVAELY
jgi:hypothetical protein